MKKKKSIYILLGVLIVLIAVYFGLQQYNKSQQEKEIKKAEAEKIHITDISSDDVESLSYTDGSTTMDFVKNDGTWQVKNDTDFPLAQSSIEAMVTSAGQLTAVRALSDTDELSDYGLDSPQYTVTLTDADGTATKLLVGNTTGEDYYLKTDQADTIYTVDSTLVQGLVFSLDDLLQMETFPVISSSTIEKVVITQNGTETRYDADNDDDADAIETIGGGLGAVSFKECVDYSLTDDKLVQYGLDEASRTKVEVTYTDSSQEEQSAVFYIGKTVTESSTVYNYVQLDGSKMVNTVSEATIKNVLNQNTDEAASEE